MGSPERGPIVGKGTIEFREAAGSLDPDWVAAWASICAGTVHFARASTPARFHQVMDRLARAQHARRYGGPDSTNFYDAISLLHDIGCSNEADFVELRMKPEFIQNHWYPCRLTYP